MKYRIELEVSTNEDGKPYKFDIVKNEPYLIPGAVLLTVTGYFLAWIKSTVKAEEYVGVMTALDIVVENIMKNDDWKNWQERN